MASNHTAAVAQMQQEGNYNAAIKQHFQQAWLADHGLGGMTPEGVKAVCTQFMHMMQSVNQAPAVAGQPGPSNTDCSFFLGKRAANWASALE